MAETDIDKRIARWNSTMYSVATFMIGAAFVAAIVFKAIVWIWEWALK